MHPEAWQWVTDNATSDHVTVLDLGGRNVNGSIRDLFPNATWTALDIVADHGVDIVADAADWVPDREYDVVVSTEVFEHTPLWPQILTTAHKACRVGGRLILTMAGPGRAPHSGFDGGMLQPGEYYGNVQPDQLQRVLESVGFHSVHIDQNWVSCDVRATAKK